MGYWFQGYTPIDRKRFAVEFLLLFFLLPMPLLVAPSVIKEMEPGYAPFFALIITVGYGAAVVYAQLASMCRRAEDIGLSPVYAFALVLPVVAFALGGATLGQAILGLIFLLLALWPGRNASGSLDLSK